MKSVLTILTLVIGGASLGGFTYWTATGSELGSPEARYVPAEVRATPGAYRSFHFWHIGAGGFRGGK